MRDQYRGECLSFEVVEQVLEVSLHRLPCNEINACTVAELQRVVEVAQASDGVRAVLFYSSLDAGFCAGADLRELHGELARRQHAGIDVKETGVRLREFLDRIHSVLCGLDMLPCTTVAALHGPVFGGGWELALTCDLLVADATARFCFPELRLGLIPGFGGLLRLQRDVGNAVLRDLLMSGRSINARRAHELGLVAQRVGKGEALPAARALARQATRFEPEAVARAKAFAKPSVAADIEREKQTFCDLFKSPVVQRALQDFTTRTDLRPYLP